MNKRTKSLALQLLAAVAIVLALFPDSAAAYLDPGTGSMLWQVLLAAVLAAGYLARRYWARIRGFLRRSAEDQPSEADDEQA